MNKLGTTVSKIMLLVIVVYIFSKPYLSHIVRWFFIYSVLAMLVFVIISAFFKNEK